MFFPTRFASNIPQNFRKILKHPVRSVPVLGSKKRDCTQAYWPPVEGACLGFLSIKLNTIITTPPWMGC